MKSTFFLILILKILQLKIVKKASIRPREKICEGIDGYRKEILSFKIEGDLQNKNFKVYIQENRKIIQHVIDYQNTIVYEVKYGGMIQLCVSNKEKILTLHLKLIVQRGLMFKEFEDNIEDESVKQEIKNMEQITKKILKQSKNLVHEQELEYIVKKSLVDKIIDSLKGKNNQILINNKIKIQKIKFCKSIYYYLIKNQYKQIQNCVKFQYKSRVVSISFSLLFFKTYFL